jgi:4-amino-4-deoxy-L-arabinose transferase-like glycosyltransferase
MTATTAYSATPRRARGAGGVGRYELAAVTVVTLAGFALRIYHLGFHSLNGGDEPFSLALAQRSFGHMFNLFGFEANGTLYSVVLWPLIRIFNQSEALIRSPAMLAGALTVPAIWWAGRELVDSRAGVAAALLMAVNPMAVFHSQLARPFAFVMLFSTLSFATLARATDDEGGRKWWVLYVASMAAAAYSNSLTPVFLLPAQAFVVVPRGRDALRAWIWALVATGALCLPLLVALVIERGRRNPLYWLVHPRLGDVEDVATEFTTGLSNLVWIYKLTGLVLLGMGGLLLVRVWRGGREAKEQLSPLAVPFAWALLPVACLFVFSQISPAFRAPYLIGALPGVLLAMAALATRLQRPAAVASLAVLAAIGLGASIHQATRQVDENWRTAVAWIAQERHPGDHILVDIPSNIPVFGYYNARWRAPDGDMTVLEWKDKPVSKDFIPVDDPHGYAGPTGPPSKELIARNASGHKRLFVVLSEYVERLQGDVPNIAGVAWAKANCQVTNHPEKNIILMVVSGCPSPGSAS